MNNSHILKSFSVFLLYIFCILSGCTYIPSTSAVHMARLDSQLYIATAKAKETTASFIRVYDVSTNKWSGKITFSNIAEPVIEKMLVDNGQVIVQLQRNLKDNGGIYSISNNGDINKLVEFTHFESLAGIDDEYYYVFESKYFENAKKNTTNWIYKGARYSKRTRTRSDSHFGQDNDLVVRDVWQDDQSYWYACFQEGQPRGYVIPEGKVVLVSKSKLDGKIDIYKFDGNNWMFDAKILGDNDWIWIFRNPRDNNASNQFIKFSKKHKTFELNNVKLFSFKPFISNRFDEKDNNLWLINFSFSTAEIKVFHVDKESLTPTQIDLPEKLRSTGIIFADKDYLWLDVYKDKSYTPSGNTIPYLLKISKKDLSYDLIFVEPTVGDAIKTILNNFFSWLFVPFLGILGR